MILVSGFNVYPNEIEGVVVMHDGVLECAAVGVPDEKSGEAVKLFVVQKDPALTAEAVHQALPRAHDRLQGAARGRVPHRAAQDQRRQDPAARTARRGARRRRRRHDPAERRPGSTPAAGHLPWLTFRSRAGAARRADAGRHEPARRHLRRLDHGAGGHRGGSIPAAKRARGRVATIAVNSFVFKQPVMVGDVVTFFAHIVQTGRTSITVDVEVYATAQPARGDHGQGDRGHAHLRCRRSGPASPGIACGDVGPGVVFGRCRPPGGWTQQRRRRQCRPAGRYGTPGQRKMAYFQRIRLRSAPGAKPCRKRAQPPSGRQRQSKNERGEER